MKALEPYDPSQINTDYIELDYQTKSRFRSFVPVSSKDIVKIVKSSAAKVCELDPIPTKLVKEHIGVIAPVLTNIVNVSLLKGKVSENFKEALLKPLIKSLQLELVFPCYRPVSNLSYCSKLIEKIAHRQLWRYVESTPMLETLQSAYRANHSMETALHKVKMYLLNNIQNQEVSCLILLNLSTAFDTISQSNLVNRLKYRFGIEGTSLEWIKSYLK